MYTGSFDIKASRVQDCVGLDMTKYGHSQTGKIKSKLRHFHLWLFPVFFCFFLIALLILCRVKILSLTQTTTVCAFFSDASLCCNSCPAFHLCFYWWPSIKRTNWWVGRSVGSKVRRQCTTDCSWHDDSTPKVFLDCFCNAKDTIVSICLATNLVAVQHSKLANYSIYWF